MARRVGRAVQRLWAQHSLAGGNPLFPASSPVSSAVCAGFPSAHQLSPLPGSPLGGLRELGHYSELRRTKVLAKTGLLDQEVLITNFAKEEKGKAVLSGDIFNVPIRRDIVHRVVVWQLAKRRQGTHSTLTISEVSGTGRKPGPQKGRGVARHGTLRGPQFRGGAIVHGPKPRNYEYGLPKQVRRLGLKVALSARLAEGKLIIFDSIIPPTSKTKDMAQILNEMEQSKRVLFVDEFDKVNESLCRATSNLYGANVLPVKGLNVYSILQHDTLVMTIGAVRSLEQRLHTPINR